MSEFALAASQYVATGGLGPLNAMGAFFRVGREVNGNKFAPWLGVNKRKVGG